MPRLLSVGAAVELLIAERSSAASGAEEGCLNRTITPMLSDAEVGDADTPWMFA